MRLEKMAESFKPYTKTKKLSNCVNNNKNRENTTDGWKLLYKEYLLKWTSLHFLKLPLEQAMLFWNGNFKKK